MKTLTKEMQEAITPTMALNLLKDGNKRFVNNLKINRNELMIKLRKLLLMKLSQR